jgi:uncharacterized membrane protein
MSTEKLFRIAIGLKGIDGASQLIMGVLLLFIPARFITQLARIAVTHDLLGNPTGKMATHLSNAANNLATSNSTHWFVIIYLLLHAVIKIGLVVAMLRKIMPAYPIAAVALAVFVVFELLRAVETHSIALPIFALLDVLIIALVVREYVQLRRKRSAAPAPSPEPAEQHRSG